MALFDGTYLLRGRLEMEARRAKDPVTKAAIESALADPDFVPAQISALNALPSAGGFAGFLALLLQYLPQIIALILSLFPAPAPTPAP